jgi:hypothetical protein
VNVIIAVGIENRTTILITDAVLSTHSTTGASESATAKDHANSHHAHQHSHGKYGDQQNHGESS